MKEEKDASMEQAILSAAEELFLEKGFALTSTIEIAKKVGCNQTLVHYYFRTKENLFQRVFEQKVRLFASTFFEIDQKGGTFEEKLTRKIEAHFDILEQNPRLPFLVINEVTTNPERLAAIKEKVGEIPRSIMAQFEKDLEEEIQKGNIRKISVIDFFITALSLNVGIFLLKPVMQNIVKVSDEEMKKIIANRKRENVKTILKSLHSE
ncbi:MAG: TetR/AcrR family transcriptional regulator [Bacteroidales bacterium]|nr:TetR/AcrR family transcriptional regulator [Bacteroidales bacterium]